MPIKPIQGKPDLVFPLNFNLKVIMENKEDISLLQERVRSHLESCGVSHSEWKHTLSKKGTYVSFSIAVVLENESMMQTMYEGFRSMNGIRMVI